MFELSAQPHLSVFPIFFQSAMVFTHMCMTSTSLTLLSWLPTYFKESFPHAKVFVLSTICCYSAYKDAQLYPWFFSPTLTLEALYSPQVSYIP